MLKPPSFHMHIERDVRCIQDDGTMGITREKTSLDESLGIRIGEITSMNVKFNLVLMFFQEMTDQVFLLPSFLFKFLVDRDSWN